MGDAQVLPDLLNLIPRDEDIGSVSGDGAYDTKCCHIAIAERDAGAVILVRKNTQWAQVASPGKMTLLVLMPEMKRLGPPGD